MFEYLQRSHRETRSQDLDLLCRRAMIVASALASGRGMIVLMIMGACIGNIFSPTNRSPAPTGWMNTRE